MIKAEQTAADRSNWENEIAKSWEQLSPENRTHLSNYLTLLRISPTLADEYAERETGYTVKHEVKPNNMYDIARKIEKDESIPDRYDIMASDILDLMTIVKIDPERLMEAFTIAYWYGFYQGNHCTINRKMKKL